MGRPRKTEQDYHNLAGKRVFEWLGPYPKDTNGRTNWRCLEGHEWMASYSSVKREYGCPQCALDRHRISPQAYHADASRQGFEWLGPHPKSVNNITAWRCKDGHEWFASHANVSRGSNCPYCSDRGAEKRRNTEQDYHDLAQARGFKWVGKKLPRNNKTKTRWQCPKDHKWKAAYGTIRKGNGCPDCRGASFKGPEFIAQTLRSMDIDFEREKPFSTCRNKNPLPFDFFVPAAKLLIEYQGEFHFQDIFGQLSRTNRNDKIKADWAQQSGYELLAIHHQDYERIPEILGARLQDYATHEYHKQGRLF